MTRTTLDRADIVHFAGIHHLSPALDDRSLPTFSAAAGDGLARCGWERFFSLVRTHGLALEYDPEQATSARLVARPPGTGDHAAGRGLRHAVTHARRFWHALFPAGDRAPP
jgi:hypothetical protein